MPTRAWTAADLDDAKACAETAIALEQLGDPNNRETIDILLLAAAEPFTRELRQSVGKEKLSLARLEREATEQGLGGDLMSRNVYDRFGYHLTDLRVVVQVLRVPEVVRVQRDKFSGEECVLLLLRRLRTPGSLLSLTYETGRCISQISLACSWVVHFIREK